MSVRPMAFSPDGTVSIWHDEGGHGGSVNLADLAFGAAIGAPDDERCIVLPCPGCGSVSSHPVGGGASPHAVQALHVLKQVQARGRTFAAAKVRVALLASQQDFPGRFKLTRVTRQAIETGAPLDVASLDAL